MPARLGQPCPMHMDEFIQPVNVDSETVEYVFTCRLETGHGTPGRSHGL